MDPLTMDPYKVVENALRIFPLSDLVSKGEIVPVNLLPLTPSSNGLVDSLHGLDTRALDHQNRKLFTRCSGYEEIIFEGAAFPGVFLLPQYCKRDFLAQQAYLSEHGYPFGPDGHTNKGPNLVPSKTLFSASDHLRWVSLGIPYDWTERSYPQTGPELPSALSDAAKEVAALFVDRYPHWKNFKPEAALVNYYSGGDRLRGHTDDVEEAQEMPLITFSLGQPAIFLLGGETRMFPPIPIVLRHGDVVVMGGKSRLAFHGVPKLLAPRDPIPFPIDSSLSFLSNFRINISVRQVWLHHDAEALCEPS